MKTFKTKSFTLIELLVVIAIIGLLVIIIAIPINRARRGASIARTLQYEASLHRYLGSDIVGWWKFDDPEDRYKDISGYNNHGSCTSCPDVVDGVPGKGGSAIDSATGVISIPHSEILSISDNLTISFWIKLEFYTDLYSNIPFAKFGNTSIANWRVYLFGNHSGANPNSEGRLGFYANRGGTWSTISSLTNKLDLQRWYYIGLSYKSEIGGQLYLDGDPFGARRGSGLLATNSSPVLIGSHNSYIIDDVRVYNRALTSEEINTLYTETKDKYITEEL